MLDLIDDDEWLELGMQLSGALRRLPAGSRVVEAVQVPVFQLAISATGLPMPEVVTRPFLSGSNRPGDVARDAVRLATAEHLLTPTSDALAVSLTQSVDGELFAVAVVGLPNERASYQVFELPHGGHSIDVGERALGLLEGWAIVQHERRRAA
ncbi:MAG: hypothetical protein ACRBI6_19315 [Acidimicrobiales bacterium]